MKTPRKLLTVLAGASVFIASSVTAAIAQTPVDPSTTPTENTGGWVFTMAQLTAVLGFGVVLFLIVMYMRYAPRFAKDEEGLRVVRADRVRLGQQLPRRDVDISQAAPVVVPPPAVPVAVGAATPAAAPAAAASAVPAAAAATDAPAPAAATDAPAPAAATDAPAPAAATDAPAPAAATDAPAPAAAPPPAAAPAAPAEHVEVTMDQAVFEEKLAELLEKGTDRRVAEGQARRAAMIAARKKAEGG
jgi:2-oxoglutarate dehydrogenase E2 component (dihydrolipoamide succinyltransferase)